MTDLEKTTTPKRCSISVSRGTYDRLRSSVGEGESIQRFVDDILVGALDDPTILARVLDKCLAERGW